MTEETNLAMVNRRENRLFNVIIGLVVVVAVLFLGMAAAVGYAVSNNTEKTTCLSTTSLRFTASIMSLLDVSTEDREAAMDRLVQQAREIDAALVADRDPCEIDLPPIEEP